MVKEDEMMRILQVCLNYSSQIGGVEEHVKNISERFAQRYDVTVFSTDPFRNLPKEEEINKVKVKRFRFFALNDYFYFPIDMFKELRNAKFDIVHAHGYRDLLMLFAALSKNANKTKFVVTTHLGFSKVGKLPYYVYNPIFGRIIFEKADKAVIVSPAELIELPLLRRYIEKVSLIPNGIDFSRFNEEIVYKKSTQALNLLYVGRIEKKKGIQYPLEALSKLSDIPAHFNIVGEGPYIKELQAMVHRYKLNSHVTFKGKVSEEELTDIYSKSHVFFLLSEFEAHSIALTEAMGSGLVPIVSNVGGNPYVVNENAGFLLDFPIDINKLASIIRMLHDDREALTGMGEKARKMVMDKFDIKTTVDRLIEVYENISE